LPFIAILRRNMTPPPDPAAPSRGAMLHCRTGIGGTADMYNAGFAFNRPNTMEAEHINSISNKLDDLAQRAAELRRYL
jgi:hypothetical protein